MQDRISKVSRAVQTTGGNIENDPPFGTQLNTKLYPGHGQIEGGGKILLDIDRVLSTQEIENIERKAA